MITVADVRRKAAAKPASSAKRKAKGKTDPPNPKGVRHMVLGGDGKIRWEWR